MILDAVFVDLKKAISSVVVKYDSLAKSMDTIEIKKDSDRFISASMKEDSFITYPEFDDEAYLGAGITDQILINQYKKDKSLIPPNLQQRLVEAQRAVVISTYVEKNNYYRMLTGLPDMEDNDFIYLTQAQAQASEVDSTKPIHEFTEDELIKIEKTGVYAEIVAANPSKKYLTRLGSNSIDIVKARTSKPFSIMFLTTDLTEYFVDEFNQTYEQSRDYFLTVIYNRDFGSRFDMYDNFIAMMIMVMTTQRLFSNTFKYGIERDFYDISSIQTLFGAYNVPYLENLPLEYQRILARNLNNLLHYKSTDKVLYDICSLLGYERINIFKYYLIKSHNLDDNENPLFIYKEEVDETGQTQLVEDKEKMYSLYFQSVELRERNTALALASPSNRLEYNSVILDDPFWQDDEDLREKIYETEFNYVETKYLGMNIMYKLTEMLFEIIYVFRLLVDKKSQTQNIFIRLPRLFQQKEISLFQITVLLCALISKKNGMAGNIISTPSKTLSILGFNFSQDFTAIKEEIKSKPHLYDQRILQYIQNMDVYSANDINNLYKNIKELEAFLVNAMAETKSLKQYRAYKTLYDSIMVTDNVTSMFTKSNGEVASTFLDYLDDTDLVLAEFVRNAESDEISEHVDHVISRLNLALKDLRHLYIYNDSNNVIITAIVTLIKFFKSYTTNLSSFNIMYLMDSRYHNMIKMLDDIKSVKKVLGLNTMNLQNTYETYMSYIAKDSRKDKLNIIDKQMGTDIDYDFNKSIPVSGMVRKSFISKMKTETKNLANTTNSTQLFTSTDSYREKFSVDDKMTKAKSNILNKDKTRYLSKFKTFRSVNTLNDYSTIPSDTISLSLYSKLKDMTIIADKYLVKSNYLGKDKSKQTSRVRLDRAMRLSTEQTIIYELLSNIYSQHKYKDSALMKDALFIEWEK